jgi:hypothetical protein
MTAEESRHPPRQREEGARAAASLSSGGERGSQVAWRPPLVPDMWDSTPHQRKPPKTAHGSTDGGGGFDARFEKFEGRKYLIFWMRLKPKLIQ